MVNGSLLSVERLSLRTRAESEATAVLEEMYAGHRLQIVPGRRRTDFFARSARAGPLSAERVRNSQQFTAEIEPADSLTFGLVTGGRIGLDGGGQSRRLASGQVLVHRLRTRVEIEVLGLEVAVLTLPGSAVGLLAESRTGLSAEELTFMDATAVSPAMGRYFADVVTFVHRQLLIGEKEALPTLVVEQLTDLVASAALSVFPNTTMGMSYLPEPGRAGASAVRRAIAFIEENAERPLTVVEIAEAVGASPRALQAAFARSLGITPMAHLRRVRLARAHGDLMAGNRGNGDTVAAIAARWGFVNPGRFTGLYVEAYKRLPSQTLSEDD